MNINPKDLKFKHPTTCVISGCTQSGKTVLMMRIIHDWKLLFDIDKNKINVLWFYGQYQNQYKHSHDDNLEINFIKGKPDEKLIENLNPDLIVLDDLMDSLKNDKILNDFFTQVCHHKRISVFFLVQNLFLQGNFMRTVSLNTHYFIIMKAPRAVKQVEYFSRQIKRKNSSEDAEKIYERATASGAYSYLLIDLHPTSSYVTRYRSRITREEVPDKFKSPGFNFVLPIIHRV
jgi:hypothetical protein